MNYKRTAPSLSFVLLLLVSGLSLTPAQAAPDLTDCIGEIKVELIKESSASCNTVGLVNCFNTDAIACANSLCPMPTTAPRTTACGQDVCGPTGKAQTGGVQACGSGVPEVGELPRTPAPPASLSELLPPMLATYVNLAYVYVPNNNLPQVVTSALPTGPFDLDLLLDGFDYAKPVNVTVRGPTGIAVATYPVTIDAENIDGRHAWVTIESVGVVAGGRYEIDSAGYRHTFYPLQRGGEVVPDWCYGAALSNACATAGLCSDVGSNGLFCPGDGSPCGEATSNPAACLGQPPEGLDVEQFLHDCGVSPPTAGAQMMTTIDCAGLVDALTSIPGLLLEVVGQALEDCGVQAQAESTTPSPTSGCQGTIATLLGLPAVVEEAVRQAIAGCGLSAPGTMSTMAETGACKALIDYALTVPGTTIATVQAIIDSCGVQSGQSQAMATDCQGAIQQALAVPGQVLGIVEGVIASCGTLTMSSAPGTTSAAAAPTCAELIATVLALPGQVLPVVQQVVQDCTGGGITSASASATTSCADLIRTVLALPGQVVPVVLGVVQQCTGTESTTCRQLLQTVLGAPGGLLATVEEVIGQCMDSSGMSAQATDCGSIVREVVGLPGGIIALVGDLVGSCGDTFGTASTQADCGSLLDSVRDIISNTHVPCTGDDDCLHDVDIPCTGDDDCVPRDIDVPCTGDDDCVPDLGCGNTFGTSAQARAGCVNLQNLLDLIGGHYKIGLDLSRLVTANSSSGNGYCEPHVSNGVEQDRSQVTTYTYRDDRIQVEDYLKGKVYTEVVEGDSCNPSEDDGGEYGFSLGWRGSNKMPLGQGWAVAWTSTAAGSEFKGNSGYRDGYHYLSTHPYVFYDKPDGAEVPAQHALVEGIPKEEGGCGGTPWQVSAVAEIILAVIKLPTPATAAWSLASIGYDAYCEISKSKNWEDDCESGACLLNVKRLSKGNEQKSYGGDVWVKGNTEGFYQMHLYNFLRVEGAANGPSSQSVGFACWVTAQGHPQAFIIPRTSG